MLAYTAYSEAGGVGKSTIAASLADEHARDGRDVVVIDLDPQYGSITHLLGVDAPRDDGGADNLVRHLVDRASGPFDELVLETRYGFDLVPNHNMLETLGDLLTKSAEMADNLDEEFEPHDRLREVLVENEVAAEYDTIIVDPPATAGPHLYNAVNATRSLVIPVEPTGKGMQSVIGLEELVAGLEDTLNAEIGVLAAIPNGVGRTSDQEEYLGEIRERGYPAPVAIRSRESLFEGCWKQQCTPRYYVEEHRSRKRDHEMETLKKLDELAASIEEVADA
ncbi:ParA family protein [Halostagnicola kamekurae]|uniref:Chromosome partitioning protein n=1 Tax=Halostagnicola kamekurae TaxID=619731 RepID=A0A1I6UXN8_9EURY|nr:ParA family protein [Halostagnicola kamekurae]SFT06144.1 chromosome partitioning protein [Halostagnicola kamekurae]